MGASLYDVLNWAKTNGEVKVVERIRLRVIGWTMREGISLANVHPDTKCSGECLDAVRRAASEVVGKPCPL